MIKKLRVKFVLINMAIVTVMLCIIFGIVYRFTENNLVSQSVSILEQASSKPFALDSPKEKFDKIRLPYFVAQISEDGTINAYGNGFFDLTDEEYLEEIVSAANSSKEKTGVLKDYNVRYFKSDAPDKSSIAFADISSEIETLDSLIQTSLITGFTSFFAFLGISFLLARWAIKPVETAWKQQKQFVADASHELKTPLTVILTNAELLQSPDYDESGKARFSQSILIMARQMRGLVEQLLDLARADGGTTKLIYSRLDFSRLISDTLLPFEPVFFEKGLTLQSEIEKEIFLTGDGGKLRRAAEILLDNAQKYSSENGNTIVTLKKTKHGHCSLCVSNSGEPIPPENLKKLFERFYRADEARNESGSFGLGLSIAESIVSEHHGKIHAESKGGMNSFIIELPTT